MLLPNVVTAAIAVAQIAFLLPLLASWIDTTQALYTAATCHIAMAVVTLLSVTVFHAPYGRYASETIVPLTVNTRAAWILQELPTLCAVGYHAMGSSVSFSAIHTSVAADPTNINAWAAIAMDMWQRAADRCLDAGVLPVLVIACFCAHYVHRTFIFPFQIQPKAATPIHVMLLANLYCCFNGTLQASAFLRFAPTTLSNNAPAVAAVSSTVATISSNPFVVCGLVVFLSGMFINVKSDYMLIALRRKGKASGKLQTANTGSYSIPRGFVFEWVSCPNFFGEGVEWLGYTLLALGTVGGDLWSSHPAPLVGFSFFLYTLSNTFPRGVKHHQWYLETFGAEYHKLNRKAVIPMIL